MSVHPIQAQECDSLHSATHLLFSDSGRSTVSYALTTRMKATRFLVFASLCGAVHAADLPRRSRFPGSQAEDNHLRHMLENTEVERPPALSAPAQAEEPAGRRSTPHTHNTSPSYAAEQILTSRKNLSLHKVRIVRQVGGGIGTSNFAFLS